MKTTTVLTIAAAAATGAALAYLLDPVHGRRRRALVRDKAYSRMKTLQERAPKIAKDLRHRAHGVVAQTRRLLGHPEPHQPR
jgi:hypothetical protein